MTNSQRKIEAEIQKALDALRKSLVRKLNQLFSKLLADYENNILIFPPTAYQSEMLRNALQKARKEFTLQALAAFRKHLEKADDLSSLKYSKLADEIYSYSLAKDLLNVDNKLVKIKRLSGRVWKLTEDFSERVELALNSGIWAGVDARTIARQLRVFLNEPNSFTDNELDNLLSKGLIDKRKYNQLKKKIAEYSPGRGVYRSARKNAERLARTEINRAYGYGDYLRRKKLPFVRGIEVKLSGSHPRPDICDDLAGKYPKDFIFTGWHPHCLCYSVSILAEKRDVERYFETGKVSWKDIEKPHKGFYQLLKKDEKGQLKKLYWYNENKKFVDNHKIKEPVKMELKKRPVSDIIPVDMQYCNGTLYGKKGEKYIFIDNQKYMWTPEVQKEMRNRLYNFMIERIPKGLDNERLNFIMQLLKPIDYVSIVPYRDGAPWFGRVMAYPLNYIGHLSGYLDYFYRKENSLEVMLEKWERFKKKVLELVEDYNKYAADSQKVIIK